MNPDANIRIVAEKAGVSTAAVSRVLNKKPNVSEAMKSKVIKACSELDYRLNPNIQDLIRKGRSGMTGNFAYIIVGSDISSPLYSKSLDGMEKAVAALNCNISLAKLSGLEKDIYELPPLLRDGRADGFLLTGALNEKIVSLLKKCGKPIVILGTYNNAVYCDLPRIALDFDSSLFKIICELKNAGKTRIAFFDDDPASYVDINALGFYKKAMAGNGLGFDEKFVISGRESGLNRSESLKKVFSLDILPFDSIITLNYASAILASHLIFANAERYERQPEVLLATFWSFSYYPLPVPTIYFDFMFEAAASKGISILEDILSGKDSNQMQKIELTTQILNFSK